MQNSTPQALQVGFFCANLIEPAPELRDLLIQVHERSVCSPAAQQLSAALRDLRCAGVHDSAIGPAQHTQRAAGL